MLIHPAIKEINEKTDINLDVEEIKVGRKVEALKFITSNKNNKQKVIFKNSKTTKSNVLNNFNNFEGRNYSNEEHKILEDKLLKY